jgi:hypothetical protein
LSRAEEKNVLDSKRRWGSSVNIVYDYRLDDWGSISERQTIFPLASVSNNIKIIERWQNRKLRLMLNANWYIRNNKINKETVKEEIRNHSRRHQTRLENHSNLLAINLLDNSEETMRLRRHGFLDLPYSVSE